MGRWWTNTQTFRQSLRSFIKVTISFSVAGETYQFFVFGEISTPRGVAGLFDLNITAYGHCRDYLVEYLSLLARFPLSPDLGWNVDVVLGRTSVVRQSVGIRATSPTIQN